MTHCITCFIIFLLFVLSGCKSNPEDNLSTPLPTLQPRPTFVRDVAPREGQILTIKTFEALPQDEILADHLPTAFESISAYKSFVCIEVDGIAQEGDDFTQDSDVSNRVMMYIDDQKIENVQAEAVSFEAIQVVDADDHVIMRGVGPKVICGEVHSPTVGVHEVMFQFRQTSGNILEYRWLFGLKDD